MKTKPGHSTQRDSRPRKVPARSANGTKANRGNDFAPELCGVMNGPSALSVCEGFKPFKFELTAEDIALDNAISTAAARSLAARRA